MQLRPPGKHEPRRCRVCGEERPLTFEHLPPRSAHNRGRASMRGIESWLEQDANPDAQPRKPLIQQRGSGAYALCEDCNNLAGRLYVPELRKWVHMGTTVLFGDGGLADQFRDVRQTAYAQVRLQDCSPARFVKQAVTMLLAMSPPDLGDRHPQLRTFVKEPDALGLPSNLQLYLALFAGPNGRYAGGASTIRSFATTGAEIHHVYELAYPPFAYILSLDEPSLVIETGNISNFATVGIHQTANVEMQLIVGYGETPFPLDFRSPAALAADVAETEATMRA